jgi:hypothetical protein
MATIIPKKLKGFRLPEVIPFELNGLALETLMVPVFRLAVLEGRDSSRATEDQASIDRAVQAFVQHPRLHGFNTPSGRRAINHITRSSLIHITRKQSSKELQINGLLPYSIASFNAGFPSNQAGFRQVDRFIYHLLLSHSKNNRAETSQLLSRIFGPGLDIKGYPEPSVSRIPGDNPDTDVITELSINLVDVFDDVRPQREAKPYTPARPLPDFQDQFGSDVYRYLHTYHHRLPTPVLIEQVTTLIAFELTIFTLKLVQRINELDEQMTGELNFTEVPRDTPATPSIYVDFTNDTRNLSRGMATSCLRRDFLDLDPFMRAIFRFRYLHGVVRELRKEAEFRSKIDKHIGVPGEIDTPKLLFGLLELRHDDDIWREIRSEARGDLREILKTNRAELSDDEDEATPRVVTDVERLINELIAQDVSPFDQLCEVLYQAQSSQPRSNISGWMRSVGGVGHPWGIVHGPSDRRSWAYAPGNDLLSVLIQLCAIDHPKWNPQKGSAPRSFAIHGFLHWLDERFGIVVDRPPDNLGFESPEHHQAARENLGEMLRRLRQMGMFEDRSDDFSVQRITPPFSADPVPHG